MAANAWLMTSAVDHGAPVSIPREIRWRFVEDGGCGGDPGCPNGPKLIGNDVCNDFKRSFRFEGDDVVWGDYWFSTLVGCTGGLSDTLLQVFKGDSLRYEIIDNELRLISPEAMAELTFRPADPQ